MSFTIACEFKSGLGITIKTSPDIAAILRNIHFRYLGVPLTPYPKQTGQEYQSRAGNTPSREFRQTLKPDVILWDVVTVC